MIPAAGESCVGNSFPPTLCFQQEHFTSGKKGFISPEIREDVAHGVMESWPGCFPAQGFPGACNEFPQQHSAPGRHCTSCTAGNFPGLAALVAWQRFLKETRFPLLKREPKNRCENINFFVHFNTEIYTVNSEINKAWVSPCFSSCD